MYRKINAKGYYEPFRAVIRNIVESGFGRREYFDGVLFSDDIEEIAKAIRDTVTKQHEGDL